jgi:hypothetical protein
MRPCAGYGKPSWAKRLQPCPREAWWDVRGKWYCAYCAKVAEGLITDAAWQPHARQERAEPRDRLQVLLEEWG